MRPYSILSSLHPVPAPPLPLHFFFRLSRRRFGRDFSHQRVEIDGPGHGEIAGAVRMEAVLCADAVGWNRIFGLKRARSRIGRRAIEIDDRVEEAARPDEGVQRFAVFLSRPELWTAARRCERRADDPDGGRR